MRGREINIIKPHGLWKYKGWSFFPYGCLSIVCGIN
jgi:hypothetical protein